VCKCSHLCLVAVMVTKYIGCFWLRFSWWQTKFLHHLILDWFLFLYILFDVQVGEVGELSEIFQWKGEVDKGLPNWEESDKEHLAEELSDVLLYLIRLSDICGIDLGDAATKKIVKNAIKYPPKACWNTSLIWVCWSLFG